MIWSVEVHFHSRVGSPSRRQRHGISVVARMLIFVDWSARTKVILQTLANLEVLEQEMEAQQEQRPLQAFARAPPRYARAPSQVAVD